MGLSIVEKIISKHATDDKVTPGAVVTAEIDLLIANELSTALAIDILETMNSPKIKTSIKKNNINAPSYKNILLTI